MMQPTELPAPDVSIVILAHDERAELLHCLDSIERHSGPLRTETILVDNGSTDGTAAAVAEHFPSVVRIELARNEGVVARNHGLRRARGRMRMFIDSDARLTPGALPELVAFLEANDGVGLVGPRLVYPDGRPQLSARRFPPRTLPLLRRPPLSRFFDEWIYGSDLPAVAVTWRVEQSGAGQVAIVRLEQRGRLFDFPLTVSLQLADGTQHDTLVRVTDRIVEQSVPFTGRLREVVVNRDRATVLREGS